jgi:hypothetical protein
MNIEELNGSGSEDREDYFWERDRQYEMAELKVPEIANLNDFITAVKTAEATPFTEFMGSLDQPSTAGKTPSHSRSYMRLGSNEEFADQNIHCILSVDSPETL